MTVSDYPDFGTPGQNVLGSPQGAVGLLRATNQAGTGNATNLPANSATTLVNTQGITQPGYEGVFQLNAPAAAGTVPFARVSFVWTDFSTGLTVGTRHHYLSAGNGPANALPYYIAGPCRGDQLMVTITNLDPAQAMTLTWTINQTSHIYQRDMLVQTSLAVTAPIGFTNPNGDPAAAVLLESTPLIGVSSTIFRLAAVYGGKAAWSVNNTSTVVLTAALVDPAQLYGSAIANQRLATMVVAGGAAQTAEVALPYGPVNLQLVNTSGTVTITPNVGLVALDY